MQRPFPFRAKALASVLAVLCAGAAHAQSHLFTFDGPISAEKSGDSVAIGGDVNKDGFDDVIVGAQLGSTNGLYAGTARVYSGATGKVLYTVHGDFKGDFFGHSVAFLGDVDLDGHDDFCVGARGDDNKGIDSGSARVFSGKTGKAIRTHDGDSFGDMFGHSVAGAGDVDKDGIPDLIVGAPEDDTGGKVANGTAWVLSGKDGKLIWKFDGGTRFDNYGWSVAGAGDANGDGHADLIVGTQQLLGTRAGYAELRSGKTGTVLHKFQGTVTGGYLGFSVAGAGDVDRDTNDDVIVGSYRESRNGQNSGAARVYSGLTGKVLRTFLGDSANDEFGTSVAGVGDLDGDGVGDVAVGAPGDDNNNRLDAGSIRAFSGKSGKELFTLNGSAALVRLGHSLAGAGDVNGDKAPDFVGGAPHSNKSGALAGRARVWTKTIALEADTHRVSLARKKSQTITIRAGVANAKKAYFLIGSVTGTTPGLKLGGLTLPLNLDPYMSIAISFPNSALLEKTLGQLDASGNATAKWNAIPQLPSTLVGQTFHHAYVVIDGGFTFTSPAAPITLVK